MLRACFQQEWQVLEVTRPSPAVSSGGLLLSRSSSVKGPTGSVKRNLHFRAASPGQGVKSQVSEQGLGLAGP